ncbi:23S rRNA (pseudouridine(1915)-N(3))-methyltransferase RlmH [Luteibaculum oceani]|uniref:Ribosomal RNA large subunit methyltransferase H n=1 Tax=Luteibaculum oceani TaxID=1294296 RepID=A0A5C6VEG6_9FLAO|nr:23S rRNA (pseudouridine(1915)-N(3))-methyltransferase RlmH [Luteibaculum oceani]TXC81518.1 23S rRNA (pseudouridine(1915)-N(3))-methyltransferase RlmH [Luteibaculum oceani]
MAVKVICFGKTEKGMYTALQDEFLVRLKKYVSISWEEIPEQKQKKQSEQQQEKEAQMVLKRLRPGDFLCLLDEGGKEFGSRKFASWLEQLLQSTSGDVIFVIGSAYGFSAEIKSRANAKLSLSKMTFNHQLVRGIFAEQLYRGLNIINGGTYHND